MIPATRVASAAVPVWKPRMARSPVRGRQRMRVTAERTRWATSNGRYRRRSPCPAHQREPTPDRSQGHGTHPIQGDMYTAMVFPIVHCRTHGKKRHKNTHTHAHSTFAQWAPPSPPPSPSKSPSQQPTSPINPPEEQRSQARGGAVSRPRPCDPRPSMANASTPPPLSGKFYSSHSSVVRPAGSSLPRAIKCPGATEGGHERASKRNRRTACSSSRGHQTQHPEQHTRMETCYRTAEHIPSPLPVAFARPAACPPKPPPRHPPPTYQEPPSRTQIFVHSTARTLTIRNKDTSKIYNSGRRCMSSQAALLGLVARLRSTNASLPGRNPKESPNTPPSHGEDRPRGILRSFHPRDRQRHRRELRELQSRSIVTQRRAKNEVDRGTTTMTTNKKKLGGLGQDKMEAWSRLRHGIGGMARLRSPPPLDSHFFFRFSSLFPVVYDFSLSALLLAPRQVSLFAFCFCSCLSAFLYARAKRRDRSQAGEANQASSQPG